MVDWTIDFLFKPDVSMIKRTDLTIDTDEERTDIKGPSNSQPRFHFYSAAASRNCYLLQNEISGDILNILNKDCVNKATTAYTGIDWRKFHKLDLVLLIPAVILGSLFITTMSNLTTGAVTFFPLPLTVTYDSVVHQFVYFLLLPLLYTKPLNILLAIHLDILLAVIVVVILRSLSSFFIIRLTLKATQGVNVSNYGLPTIFRSYAFVFFCFVIVGIMPLLFSTVFLPLDPSAYLETNIPLPLDIGLMFLLTWVVWWWYIKRKVKRTFSTSRLRNIR